MKISPVKYHLFSGGLLSQVSLLALVTTTVILAFFGWQRIQTQSQNLTRSLHTSIEANSNHLATALALPLYNFDDETVTALCNSLLADLFIIRISVNANGQHLTFPPDSSGQTAIPTTNTILVEKNITHNSMVIGKVSVTASTESLQKLIQQATRSTVLQIIILDLFLVLTIVFLLSRQFIRPLGQLQEAAKEIAEGNLSHAIKLRSRNEIGQLADNLEAMRLMLQEKISALEGEINERTKAENELSKTKNYLDNIINSMPSQLIGVDADNRITLWNKQVETVNNIAPSSIANRTLSEVFPHLAAKNEQIAQAIATNQVIYDNAHATQSSDSLRYEDITIYPLITNGVQGAVIRIDDITHQHNMQEELAHNRKLEAIGQLAGGVAHDFNNMLGGILGGAELLGMHLSEDDAKGQEFLDIIIQSGRRAGELNRKLLSFARKDKIESTAVDVAHAVRETESILTHTLDKKINLSVDVNAKNTMVTGDLSQLQNALINLGINGGHAMPEGGSLSYRISEITLDRAYCTASRFDIEPGSYLKIEICDTGTGIPLKDQRRIFDPFFTTKGQGKGTGLGLAAVHGTVQQHQGAITVYSEPGKGTCFHIYLPLAEQQTPQHHNHSSVAITGKGTILVIDDESVIRTTASGILEHLGYKVILAENGKQGLDIYKEHSERIDLIITDLIMPEMNGRECFLAMKEIKKNVRVIVASGFSRDTDIEELKEKGLRDFIRKPYTTIELSKAVALALAG